MRAYVPILVMFLAACSGPSVMMVVPDGGIDPAGDSGWPSDDDAQVVEVDAGNDSGLAPDAGQDDGGLAPDAGASDAGVLPDSAVGDAGPVPGDAGSDSGSMGSDAGPAPDAGPPSPGAPVQLALGRSHSCLLRSGGGVWCWGDTTHGALGSGPAPLASPVYGMTDAVEIAASTDRSCALRSDGSVWCWGRVGLPGRVESAEPVRIAGVSAMDAISAQCGVTVSGGVECWGDSMAPGAAITNAVDVDQRDTGYCALRADGSVTCWGAASTASVGPFAAGMRDISVSGSGACTLGAGGGVWCWDGASPPAGAGGAAGETSPYAEVSVGRNHACGRRENGSVWCWGNNDFGQLGRATDDMTATARYAAGEVLLGGARMDAVAVDAGHLHTCAALRDGRVVCWGSNDLGQLGTWVPGLETAAPVEPDAYWLD